MQKPKEYDWKDSNMAMFGSDTDRKVKKESAESEPAWKGAGQAVGLQIWRIVKFKVTHWDKEEYGKFYKGDSYIILNTYKDPEGDALLYDVHFWIGKYSTQDEYGTAAYKTVELDTLLDDKPIQHREVQGHESELFKGYFETLTLLKGGADTGFRRVLPEAYQPRLMHVQKQGKVFKVTEVPMKKGNLNSGDVFIIDSGNTIYQYNGAKCTRDEKFHAAGEIAKMKSSRSKSKVEVLEEASCSKSHPALMLLREGTSKEKTVDEKQGNQEMFAVSDADGSLDLDPVEGFGRNLLNSNDVFVINCKDHVFCWVGNGASVDERRNGMAYASNYLNQTETPWLPISVVAEGKESPLFNEKFPA